jgi:hypothetical protein
MSKAARKSKRSKKHIKPHVHKAVLRVEQNEKRRFVVFIIIAILAAIPFGMGKYFELNSFGPYDSGAYVYSAAHILSGAEIGVEEKPSAQLGTLLVNILGVRLFGFRETGPKLIQMILQAAALLLMFTALRKLFGMLAATVGVIVASVYLSSPLIAKVGNVKEQYMIACMIMGVCCFVLYELGGKWWHAMLTGAFLIWAPLFKQTGVSATAAIGLFVTAQPLFKRKAWKQAGRDILLLLGGAVVGVAPLYVWILAWNVQLPLPYSFVWQTLAGFLPAASDAEQAKAASDYISRSRRLVPFSQQWPKVLYYYRLLIMPIALAAAAIVVRIVRMFWRASPPEDAEVKTWDRFVLLFAVWWVLDMAFVWISPRSYVQYYLPLNASAAMLGAYVVAIWWGRVSGAVFKTRWVITGLAGLLLMIVFSWHIFFGTGVFTTPSRNGYTRTLREVSLRRKGLSKNYGEAVGDYIRESSTPSDKIYVWGWVPGIYVKAQRFSSASRAFSMPRPAPQVLAQIVSDLLSEFKGEMPKYIVDTRKRHIPVQRPAYELWPIAYFRVPGREEPVPNFLPPVERQIAEYDEMHSKFLRENFGEDEAERYKVLAPFRKFVMDNYRIVEPSQYGPATVLGQRTLIHRRFGLPVLFEWKSPTADKELQ